MSGKIVWVRLILLTFTFLLNSCATEQHLTDLKQKIDEEHNKKLNALENRLSGQHKHDIHILQDSLTHLRIRVQQLEKNDDLQTRDISGLQSEIERLEDQLSHLKDQYAFENSVAETLEKIDEIGGQHEEAFNSLISQKIADFSEQNKLSPEIRSTLTKAFLNSGVINIKSRPSGDYNQDRREVINIVYGDGNCEFKGISEEFCQFYNYDIGEYGNASKDFVMDAVRQYLQEIIPSASSMDTVTVTVIGSTDGYPFKGSEKYHNDIPVSSFDISYFDITENDFVPYSPPTEYSRNFDLAMLRSYYGVGHILKAGIRPQNIAVNYHLNSEKGAKHRGLTFIIYHKNAHLSMIDKIEMTNVTLVQKAEEYKVKEASKSNKRERVRQSEIENQILAKKQLRFANFDGADYNRVERCITVYRNNHEGLCPFQNSTMDIPESVIRSLKHTCLLISDSEMNEVTKRLESLGFSDRSFNEGEILVFYHSHSNNESCQAEKPSVLHYSGRGSQESSAPVCMSPMIIFKKKSTNTYALQFIPFVKGRSSHLGFVLATRHEEARSRNKSFLESLFPKYMKS